MGTRDLSYAQTAKELGVSKQELRTFLETRYRGKKPGERRPYLNKKLYDLGERKQVREKLGVTRIRTYEFRENVLLEKRRRPRYQNERSIGRMVQRLYYVNDQGRQNWSVYTREHGLPTSITAIRVLYHNDKISDSQYARILSVWRKSYPMSDEWYAEFVGDDVDAFDDYETEAMG